MQDLIMPGECNWWDWTEVVHASPSALAIVLTLPFPLAIKYIRHLRIHSYNYVAAYLKITISFRAIEKHVRIYTWESRTFKIKHHRCAIENHRTHGN